MQVFVVSLKNSDRRELFCQMAEKYQIDFQFFDAVNGADFAQTEIDKINERILAEQLYPRKLARGEIGCSLSHRKIYQQIAGKNCWVIILEDDVIFDERLQQLISATTPLNQLDRQSLYHLGGSFPKYETKRIIKKVRGKIKISNDIIFHKTMFSEKYIYGTWGYLIHSELAENILAYVQNHFLLADEWYILTKTGIIRNIYLSNIAEHSLDTSCSLIQEERQYQRSLVVKKKPHPLIRLIQHLLRPVYHLRKLCRFF